MFEVKVAAVLNQQLGAYVLGLDAETLKIGVWSGEIVLENLQARPQRTRTVAATAWFGSIAVAALCAWSHGSSGARSAKAGCWPQRGRCTRPNALRTACVTVTLRAAGCHARCDVSRAWLFARCQRTLPHG
jgi:hypothetical protein